ncbi:MAG: hypothetical protein ACE5ED_13230 [Rhodothalassiaceae bacterium]
MAHLRPRVYTAADARRAQAAAQVRAGAGGATPGEDSYLAKIVTYIPAEAIATYQAIVGVVPDERGDAVIPWVAGIILLLTPLWMYVATKDENEPPAWHQIIAAPVAFAVWLIAIGSPLVDVVFGAPIEPWLGSVILIAATAVIPLVEKAVIK